MEKSTEMLRASEGSPDLSFRQDAEEEASHQAHGEEQPEGEEAKAIDEVEAARALGRKRPRRSLHNSLPEDSTQEVEELEPEETPAKKRRRSKHGPANWSPAKQKQGQLKTKAKSKAKEKQRKTKTTTREPRVADEAPEGDKTFEVTVQRFTRRSQPSEGDSDQDIFDVDIPFGSRSGVNTIDVLSQLCDEVIQHSLELLEKALNQTGDSFSKKECRIKLLALKAYREELKTRFLQHVSLPPRLLWDCGADRRRQSW